MLLTVAGCEGPFIGFRAAHAISAKARLYDHLFTVEKPEEGDFKEYLNPNSLVTLEGCKLEPGMAEAQAGTPYQFERIGYFCLDGAGLPPRRARIQPDRRPSGLVGATEGTPVAPRPFEVDNGADSRKFM